MLLSFIVSRNKSRCAVRPTMLPESLLIISTFVTSAVAQSIIPSTEPSCANTCPVFVQAQAACSTDAGNQAQYQSCFCQSAYLSTIKSAPTNNLCAPTCSDSDFGTIASWYNGLCSGGAAPAPGQTTLATTTTPAPTQGQATTTASSASSSASAESATSDVTNDSNPADWTDASSWCVNSPASRHN